MATGTSCFSQLVFLSVCACKLWNLIIVGLFRCRLWPPAPRCSLAHFLCRFWLIHFPAFNCSLFCVHHWVPSFIHCSHVVFSLHCLLWKWELSVCGPRENNLCTKFPSWRLAWYLTLRKLHMLLFFSSCDSFFFLLNLLLHFLVYLTTRPERRLHMHWCYLPELNSIIQAIIE